MDNIIIKFVTAVVTGKYDDLVVFGPPMVVNGQTYDPARGVPPMTAFRALLNDEETAAVLTFVRNTWGNKDAYDATAQKLATQFNENFARFADQASIEILAAAPRVQVG